MNRCQLSGWAPYALFFESPHHLLKRKPFFFFFNDTATTEIYTLSLHDALPISQPARVIVVVGEHRVLDAPLAQRQEHPGRARREGGGQHQRERGGQHPQPLDFLMLYTTLTPRTRSEEHTSELPSHSDLRCRPLP